MSDFLVFHKTKGIDYDAFNELKSNMHLQEPIKLFCHGYNIWLFGSLNSNNNSNTIYRHGKDWAFAAGTFYYKNFSFIDSLKYFYDDFISKTVIHEEMYGHFAILMVLNDIIYIINDSLGSQRIFGKSDRSIISTLFLATWFSNKEPLYINKDALYEKISIGYITAPDTLIEGIVDLTYENFNDRSIIKFQSPIVDHFIKSNEKISFQANALHNYFDKLISFTNGQTISLGVSGGFDSRLLLALIKEHTNIYLYTHGTKGIHTQESAIAKKLADVLQIDLSIKETEQAENLNQEQAENLLTDLVYYFDGRTANNSGAFSFTGSFYYNIHHLNSVFLGLNGKGGEVYRNYYNIAYRRYYFKNWFMLLECYPSFKFIFSAKKKAKILGNIENKINKRLTPEGKKWNRWFIQRFYSEIRQPDCEASIVNAHNKITHFIAPFLDANLLKFAYKSFDKKGASVCFQAKLIQELSIELANVDSKYGFNFASKSFRWKFIEWVKRNLPIWYKRKRRETNFIKSFKRIKPSIHVKAAVELLAPIFPEIIWKYAVNHHIQRNVVIFLAHLIKEGKKYNKLK